MEFRGNWDVYVHADSSAPLSSQKCSLVVCTTGRTGIFNKALLGMPGLCSSSEYLIKLRLGCQGCAAAQSSCTRAAEQMGKSRRGAEILEFLLGAGSEEQPGLTG